MTHVDPHRPHSPSTSADGLTASDRRSPRSGEPASREKARCAPAFVASTATGASARGRNAGAPRVTATGDDGDRRIVLSEPPSVADAAPRRDRRRVPAVPVGDRSRRRRDDGPAAIERRIASCRATPPRRPGAPTLGLDFGTTTWSRPSPIGAAGRGGAGDVSDGAITHSVFRSALDFWTEGMREGRRTLVEAGPWAIAHFVESPEGSRFLQSFKTRRRQRLVPLDQRARALLQVRGPARGLPRAVRRACRRPRCRPCRAG